MQPAADVYELIVHQTTSPTSWWIELLRRVRREQPDPGGIIISVLHRETGDELFRHIEEGGDDEDHVLLVIQEHLAAMTVNEFKARWGS